MRTAWSRRRLPSNNDTVECRRDMSRKSYSFIHDIGLDEIVAFLSERACCNHRYSLLAYSNRFSTPSSSCHRLVSLDRVRKPGFHKRLSANEIDWKFDLLFRPLGVEILKFDP